MSASPVFAITPRIGYARAVAAMANNRDGSSTTGLVSVITGAAGGTRIERAHIRSIAAVGGAAIITSQVWRFYLYDAANYRLVHEQLSGTIALPTVTLAGYSETIVFNQPLVLPSASWQLLFGKSRHTTAVQDDFDCIVFPLDL